MLGRIIRPVLALLVFTGFAANAQAARVTPMALDLEPTGTRSSARIEVTNNEDKQLPVEVRMYKGVIDERGKLDLQPADDRFMVFPPQTLIQPNGQQVFRIQYLPNDVPSQSEIYYAAVSQIPVQLPSDQSRIQVVMRFNVLVNVVPDGTKPDPHVAGVTPIVQEMKQTAQEQAVHPDTPAVTKQPGLEVRVENSGTRYFAAGRSAWTVSGTDRGGKPYSMDFSATQMSEMIGMGIVAPGKARIFFVPTPDELAAGASVTIKM